MVGAPSTKQVCAHAGIDVRATAVQSVPCDRTLATKSATASWIVESFIVGETAVDGYWAERVEVCQILSS